MHLTTAHSPTDNRIYVKECRTLAAAGYDVLLIAPDYDGVAPLPMAAAPPVAVHTFPAAKTRVERMTRLHLPVYRAASRQRAAVYHIHDPELLPVALLLKARRRSLVVYDAHEDLAAQVLTKPWIPSPLRRPAAVLASGVERVAGRWVDLVVVATPSIQEGFPAQKTVIVRNLPQLGELVAVDGRHFADRPRVAAYVGLLNENRGARELLAAAATFAPQDDIVVKIAGECDPPGLAEALRSSRGGQHVRLLGLCSREQVRELLGESRVGVLPFLPVPNHLQALPTKLFEYMAAGLPVVACDLPMVREVVLSTGCGTVVDPRRPADLARAVRYYLDNPDEAEAVGRRGQRCVEVTYNWTSEGRRLVDAYRRLVASERPPAAGAGPNHEEVGR